MSSRSCCYCRVKGRVGNNLLIDFFGLVEVSEFLFTQAQSEGGYRPERGIVGGFFYCLFVSGLGLGYLGADRLVVYAAHAVVQFHTLGIGKLYQGHRGHVGFSGSFGKILQPVRCLQQCI